MASIGVVEHLGSGAVLDATVSRGNGDGREMFCRAADAVVETMAWLDRPLSEALLLSDGEFGWVPYFTECEARGLAFLTRCSRYELLARPDIRARLEQGPWSRVDDSGSGPTRWAVEVGTIELEPGRDTFRDDGSRYNPVKVRLVASRYEAQAEGRGCGSQVGGHRFELYASLGVPSSSLSASDVVTMFYARCGQENAFLQQKALGVHRVVSNTLAGQLFAAVAAFLVWNLRLVAGFQLSPPQPEGLASVPREVVAGEAPILPALPAPSPPVAPGVAPSLADALARVDWDRFLRIRAGWSWNADRGVLVDPHGTELALSGVERNGNRRKLRFQGRGRAPQATYNVPEDVGIEIATALRGEPPAARAVPVQTPVLTQLGDPPPLAIRWPEFTCAAARNTFKLAARQTVVTVRVPPPRPAQRGHPLVEPSRHRRRHRRLTWAERAARNSAPRGAVLHVATPDEHFARWLRELPSQSAGARPAT